MGWIGVSVSDLHWAGIKHVSTPHNSKWTGTAAAA